MKILITVPVLSPGSGLTRYVFTLCKILHKDNNILVLETHGQSPNSYAKKELMDINPDIKLTTTDTTGRISKYLKNILITLRFKPDVIISNYNALTQFILPFCKGKAKVIHILHNDTDDFYRVGAINGGKVDIWIAPTSGIAERFNKYTQNKYQERVIVISHGVEEASFSEKTNQRLEIVYAGVLYEHKGVKILPVIIKNLLHKGINLHFTIIGGGLLKEWLNQNFKDEINAGIVTMTGVIPHDEVYAFMSKADIFLYPTHLDAFGLVIAEAMMNGAVPVVTRLEGVTDNLIPDKHCGYLIAQDDIDKFVNAVTELYASAELRKSISRNAHHRAMECFSHRAMKDAYLNYLRNLN